MRHVVGNTSNTNTLFTFTYTNTDTVLTELIQYLILQLVMVLVIIYAVHVLLVIIRVLLLLALVAMVHGLTSYAHHATPNALLEVLMLVFVLLQKLVQDVQHVVQAQLKMVYIQEIQNVHVLLILVWINLW